MLFAATFQGKSDEAGGGDEATFERDEVRRLHVSSISYPLVNTVVHLHCKKLLLIHGDSCNIT